MFNRTPASTLFNSAPHRKDLVAVKICGSEDIKALLEHLGIKNGETTKDGLFTPWKSNAFGGVPTRP
jgi:NADH dehydrogenase (ubiquinone) flavoprotein 2